MELRAVAATPETWLANDLHCTERAWPETNCYLDLWIGLLSAIGQDPRPLLGVAAALRWEGDHFSFLKPNAADIGALTGAVLQEMALWDGTENHVAVQLGRGAVPLLEVDAWFLPDTHGTAYRTRHTKTTIAIIAQDRAAGGLEYFHNAGLFRLNGEDYAGILGLEPYAQTLFPYAELVHLPQVKPDLAAQLRCARAVLARLAASRGEADAIADFAADLPALMARMQGDPHRVHAMCFNTVRQLGAACGLLADHLAWLGADGHAAAELAGKAKTLQFRMSRAARRGSDDGSMVLLIEDMRTGWQEVRGLIEAACVPPDTCGRLQVFVLQHGALDQAQQSDLTLH